MAKGGTVEYNVKFNLDKTGLNELKKQLTDIRLDALQAKITGNLTKDLEEARDAASQLEDILNSSWNSKLNQLDLSKVNTSIRNTYGTVENLQKALVKSGSAGAAAYNNFAMTVLNTNVQLKRTSETLDKMAVTFKNTIRYGISSSVFNSLSNSVQKAYNYTKQLDTSLNDIRIVTGKSAEEMDKFAIRANQVAKDLGRSTKDFTEASLIYYQQGLGNEEAQARAEVTMKAANVTGQTGQAVSEQLTAVWNGYKVTAEETELYVDKLAAVAATTASDLEELSTGMSKVASAANIMGVDVDQLNAQLATIVSVTRQAPESVGVALKTIYARMGDIKAGLDDETTLGNYTSKMAELGFNVLDANGNLRDMGEVIEEIGSKWTSLSREQQMTLSQTMAGTRQYNNLLSLFDNWDMYTEALETSANAAGTLQKQQDIYMESTEAHLQRLSTEAERTYDILFDQDTVNGFADALTGVLSIFNNLLAGLGGGTSDFIFFGSTIANIFNKQIGGAIERQIENIETMKANLNREELQRQIIYTHVARGEGVTNAAALEKEIPYTEKTLELQKYLTQEQAEQFVQETAEIGLLEQRIQGITQYKDIAKELGVEIGANSAETLENFKEQIEATGKIQTEESKRFSNLKKNFSEYVEGTEHAFETTESQAEITNSLIDDIEKMTSYKANEIEMSKITAKIAEGEKLSEEEIKFILDNQRDTRNDINNKINALKTGAQGVADEEAGLLIDLQNEQTLRENNLRVMQEQAERQKTISELVQGVTALISLVTSLSGIIKTLNDEDLSAGEKAERIITVLVSMLPMLLMNLQSLKGLLPAVAKGTNMLAIAMGAEGVTAASGFGASLAGVIAIAAPYVLAIGAIVGAIYLLVKASKAEQEEIDNMRKASEALSNQAQETKKTIDDLKTSLNGYEEAVKTLQSCREGTDEWNTALQDVNDSVLDILEKYPQLAKIQDLIKRDSDTGLLSIDKNILTQYQRALEQRYITQRAGAVTASAQADKKQTDKDSKDLLNTINTRFRTLQSENMENFQTSTGFNRGQTFSARPSAVDFLNKSQMSELYELAKVEDLYNDKIQEYADKMVKAGNITEQQSKQWVSTMETYREQISELGVSSSEAANEIENAAKIVASTALGANATNVQQQMFANKYSSTYEEERKKADTMLRSGFSRFSGVDNDQYKEALKQYDKAMGGGIYEAAHGSNPVRGNNGQNGIYFWNRETQQDEKIDREVIIDAIASYNATQNAEKAKTYNEAAAVLEKVAKAGSIDEDLADKVLSKTFDVNDLTEDEYNKIKENKDKIEEALTDDQFKEIGLKSAEDFKTNFENELDKWDPKEAAQRAQERFKTALESAGAKAENLFDLDGEEFSEFGEYLAEIADESDKLADSLDEDADATAVVTQSILRMNRGVESLADNWEDWIDILKNSSKESQEYWKALKETQDALIDLLDAEEDIKKFLDDDFIKDNAADIEKAANGDADAIDRLRQAALEKIVLNIELNDSALSNEQLWEKVQNLQTLLNGLDLKIDIGTTIEDQSFIDACNEMIESANLTKEQANAIFGQMGFQANYATEEQPTSYSVPIYTTYVRTHKTRDDDTGLKETGWIPQQETMTVQTDTQTLTGKYATFAMSTSTPDGGGTVPKISGLTKKANGGMNNYSSVNKGGGSPSSSGKSSGGGSSAKDPKTLEKIDDEADRYHQVDTQIKKVDNSLSKLQSRQDKFVGSKLIDNLNKQWEQLNKQIENYNQKLGIAQKEQAELSRELSSKGVRFNADGTIANYMAAFQAQENAVNSLIAQYNSLSASQQEVWDNNKTIDTAKEQFEKFKENLDRYDELVSDFIPQLEQNIFDAFDEQVELNIQKFNMEIEVTLDMNQATRDWNEWRKKNVEKIKDEDLLGNSKARLEDFDTYFNALNTGDIQTGTKHLTDLLEQLKKYDADGKNVYGDNRAKALEDLRTYYTQLMESIENVNDLQEEVHQNVLDEMDTVQDKFDEQIESYEFLRDIIEHDIKVIQLTLGDDAYGEMAKFYEMQQENYQTQLDFQRKQQDFWKAQMDAAEVGSDEWNKAREKWEEAVDEFNSLLEEGIQNATDKFENMINNIFKNLNNQVTNGMGLDYVNTEWDLINQNADRYLDTINASYGIRDLEKKYQDSINNTNSITVQQRLKKVMEDQLDVLKQKDKLTQYDIDRANKLYEIELARIQLEEAQQNKSQMRLRRDSQGNYTYQYVGDQGAIQDAEDQLSKLYNDLYNFDKDRYQTVLNDIYSIWDSYQQAMAEAALINDPEERAAKEKLIQDEYNELMMQAEEDYQTAKADLRESFFWDYVDLNRMSAEEVAKLTETEKDAVLNEMIPTWTSGVSEMADAFYGENGFSNQTIDAWNQIKDAENEYEEDLKTLEEVAGITYETIINGEDLALEGAQELIKSNDEVIEAYENELTEVQKVYDEIQKLVDKYKEAKQAAIEATEAAYKYEHREELEQAEAAAKQKQTENAANAQTVVQATTKTTSSTTATAAKTVSNPYSGYRLGGATYTIVSGDTLWGIAQKKYGNGSLWQEIYNHNRGVIGGNPNLIYPGQVLRLNTGGYTGDWPGNTGRIAELHQKELVLNAQDTENMLNAVSIMRTLTNSLGSSVLARLAGATAQGYTGGASEGSALEQNVHIDAQFPNVRDALEIEQALNNLVNAAAQRAFEK